MYWRDIGVISSRNTDICAKIGGCRGIFGCTAPHGHMQLNSREPGRLRWDGDGDGVGWG